MKVYSRGSVFFQGAVFKVETGSVRIDSATIK